MFPTIPIWEVDQYIDSGCDIMLIDLRNRASYNRYHIRGAVNLPFDEMNEWVSNLPDYELLIFYCTRGGQSMMACRTLAQDGYSVVAVVNGIDYYRGKYLVRG